MLTRFIRFQYHVHHSAQSIETEYDILHIRTRFRTSGRMLAPPVSCETAALAERLVAHVARERFVAGVRAPVPRQSAPLAE